MRFRFFDDRDFLPKALVPVVVQKDLFSDMKALGAA